MTEFLKQVLLPLIIHDVFLSDVILIPPVSPLPPRFPPTPFPSLIFPPSFHLFPPLSPPPLRCTSMLENSLLRSAVPTRAGQRSISPLLVPSSYPQHVSFKFDQLADGVYVSPDRRKEVERQVQTVRAGLASSDEGGWLAAGSHQTPPGAMSE